MAEVSEVFVVHKDLDSGGGAQEIVVPGVEGSHDSKQLPVVNVVVAFRWAKHLG